MKIRTSLSDHVQSLCSGLFLHFDTVTAKHRRQDAARWMSCSKLFLWRRSGIDLLHPRARQDQSASTNTRFYLRSAPLSDETPPVFPCHSDQDVLLLVCHIVCSFGYFPMCKLRKTYCVSSIDPHLSRHLLHIVGLLCAYVGLTSHVW